jgi:hypothetical protein
MVTMTTRGDKQKQQSSGPPGSPTVWKPQGCHQQAGASQGTDHRGRPAWLRASCPTQQDRALPGSAPGTNEHHASVHTGHKQGHHHGQGTTDSQPKFQVAIRNLGQQESNQGKAAKMHVRLVPHAPLVLDCSGPTQVPKQAHCDSED